MTMRELAELANVSVSTVSKAFNDADDICIETKQHIFEIAKQHGCYGKFYKGKYSKKIIAIICSDLISNYYINFIEKLQHEIERHNGMVMISSDHFNKAKQSELIDYYASYLHVDGIIVFGLGSPIKKGYDIPIVSLFSSIDDRIDSINITFKYAIEEAVDKLYTLGHKSIAFIGEKHTLSKAKTFESAAKAYGIKCTVIESEYRFEKAGKQGVKELLSHKNDCTAIICGYDNIAYGAIKQLKTEGYKVPEDYSVIGMDNLSLSESFDTELTSIDSSPDEICELACDLLQKKQKNKYYRSNKKIIINAKLITRGSIAKAKTNIE